jgi:hypothetical protein
MFRAYRLTHFGLIAAFVFWAPLLAQDRKPTEVESKAKGADSKAKEAETAKAKETDAIGTKLEKAKSVYDAEVKKHRESLLELLQKKEESAARAGDKALRDQVRVQRDSFLTKGELPDVVPLNEYRLRMRQAVTVMEAAYKQAVKDYLIAKKDFDADLIDKELTDFKAKLPNLSTTEVWVGTTGTGRTPARLEIESVENGNFKGRYCILFPDGTIKAQDRVDGKFEKGKITWKHVNTNQPGVLVPCVASAVISVNRMEGTWETIEGRSKGPFSLVLENKKK